MLMTPKESLSLAPAHAYAALAETRLRTYE